MRPMTLYTACKELGVLKRALHGTWRRFLGTATLYDVGYAVSNAARLKSLMLMTSTTFSPAFFVTDRNADGT